MANFLTDLFGPDAEDVGAASAGISAETYANRDAIIDAARQFNQDLPSYVNRADSLMQEQAANEFQNQKQQIKSNANNRGLLYSGLREGAEGAAGNNIASGLAQRRAKLNTDALNAGFQANTMAANAGMSVSDLERQRANQQYRATRGAQQQDQGLVGGFLRGFA